MSINLLDSAKKNVFDVSSIAENAIVEVNAVDDFQRTALHWYAWHGNETAVQWLLEKGADPNQRNWVGWNPLHSAVYRNQLAVCRILVKSSIPIELDATTSDVFEFIPAGMTPLQMAIRLKHKEIVLFLASASRPTIRSLTEGECGASIRLIPFQKFKDLGTTPRYPNNKDITITLSELTEEQFENSFIVFISHCWLRGWSGADGWSLGPYPCRPHPDTAAGDKYLLCREGIEILWKSLAPKMQHCLVWLDYGCINQDADPAGELRQLDKIVQVCDCIFTPIHDVNHLNWELPPAYSDLFRDYQAELWNAGPFSYLNRGWCRVEMFYAANVPTLYDSEARNQAFAAGLAFHRRQGRRPHFLFGTKELTHSTPPLILNPLQNSYFKDFHPEKGNLTQKADLQIIKRLIEELKPYMVEKKPGYDGEKNEAGQRHGFGKCIYPSGDSYEGMWKEDKIDGDGRYEYSSGFIYDGEWKQGKRDGKGVFYYTSGNVYDGDWVEGKMHGMGTFTYADGNVWTGQMVNGKMSGRGRLQYSNGDVYEGDWFEDQFHGQGRMTYHSRGGDYYDGEWVKGEKHGLATVYEAKTQTVSYVKYGKGSCQAVIKSGRADDPLFAQQMMMSSPPQLMTSQSEGEFLVVKDYLINQFGDVYDGTLVAGKKVGYGKLTFSFGDVYEGQFRDDLMHGFGKYTYASGDCYEGDWKEGKIDGLGKFTFQSEGGNYYDGQFKQGLMDGKGMYVYVTRHQEEYVGEWKENCCDGLGKYLYPNGDYYEGLWSKGVKVEAAGTFYSAKQAKRASLGGATTEKKTEEEDGEEKEAAPRRSSIFSSLPTMSTTTGGTHRESCIIC